MEKKKRVKLPPLTDEQSTLAGDNHLLAMKVASTYLNRYPNLADEIRSAAYLGLCNAARRFDASLENKLSVYAWPHIEGKIREFLKKERNRPKPKQIDDELGSGLPDLAVSTVKPPGYEVETQELAEKLIGCLEGREADVIRVVFYAGMTIEETAELFGISRSTILNTYNSAIERMQESQGIHVHRIRLLQDDEPRRGAGAAGMPPREGSEA